MVADEDGRPLGAERWRARARRRATSAGTGIAAAGRSFSRSSRSTGKRSTVGDAVGPARAASRDGRPSHRRCRRARRLGDGDGAPAPALRLASAIGGARLLRGASTGFGADFVAGRRCIAARRGRRLARRFAALHAAVATRSRAAHRAFAGASSLVRDRRRRRLGGRANGARQRPRHLHQLGLRERVRHRHADELLDGLERVDVVLAGQRKRLAGRAGPRGAADAVHVVLGILGQVVVEDVA